MIKIILLIVVTFIVQPRFLKGQDFLEVKYSINDIMTQRENFKNEKVRAVTVKNIYIEKIYKVDREGKLLSEEGKGDNPYTKMYNYDMHNNLVNSSGTTFDEFYEYDEKGNVVKYTDGEIVYKYSYDADNRLITENGDESMIEYCAFEKIYYVGSLVKEIVYPCCEGNYSRTITYDYSQNEQLLMVISYLKNCNDGTETDRQVEQYFYKENSSLPYKMDNGDYETNFIYEYFD